MVYQFIKRLATPFTSWKAYELGVIDDHGNIVIKRSQRTPDQKKAFGKFDLMILKLKKLLGKIPGGSSKIASYMAALWLIKEWNQFSDLPMITESTSEAALDDSLNLFLEWYLYHTTILSEDNYKVFEDEGGAPTVNVGSGAIAGLGVGPQGEPGLTRSQQKKHRQRALATVPDNVKRKTFASFMGERSTTKE
jgi:hypothetical protein